MTLTDEQIEELISLLHWIPVKQGLLRDWLAQNAEGRTAVSITDELQANHRIERTGEHFPAYRLIQMADLDVQPS
jgi:phage tail protein X